MKGDIMDKAEALRLAEERISKLKIFLKWRAEQEALLLKKKFPCCSCLSTYLNPSWASDVHGIRFHVCTEHSEKFSIHYGPFWDKDLITNKEELAIHLLERHRYRNDTEYRLKANRIELERLKAQHKPGALFC